MSWGTIILFWAVWVVVAVAIANAKNRSVGEAVLLSALLGLIGVIIVACWRKIDPAALPPAGFYPDPSGDGGHRYWDGRVWSGEVSK